MLRSNSKNNNSFLVISTETATKSLIENLKGRNRKFALTMEMPSLEKSIFQVIIFVTSSKYTFIPIYLISIKISNTIINYVGRKIRSRISKTSGHIDNSILY